MEERGSLDGVAGMVMKQSNIERIGEIAINRGVAPGGHVGVVADATPIGFIGHLGTEVVTHFGETTACVDIVAHFNQPVEILMAGEAPIEAKRGPNRIGIGRIIRVKLPETGLQLALIHI